MANCVVAQCSTGIGSLTTSLRCQLVKYMPTKLSKDSSIFPTKKQCICNINILNFKETFTNDVVNFEQLAPEWQTV